MQDFLLNRLNYDPIVWMGCSQREILLVAALISAPLLLLGATMGYLAWGNIPFGMLPGLLLSVVGITVGLKAVARVKRDKEPGFLNQVVTDKLEQWGVKKTPIIRRSGSWSVGTFL